MTTPEMAAASLTLTLFGPMQVLVEGRPLPHLRSRKALWVLALLALRQERPVEREWLAGTLWPDTDQSQAFANLRPTLSELRQVLGSQGRRLQSPGRHTLLLDLTGAQVDVLTFDSAMANRQLAELAEAVTLYRGPLLEGCFEEWVHQERAVREQNCLQALQTLADAALTARDYDLAVRYYHRAVGIDPLWDTARRGWMEALVGSGDRNAALQVYREFVDLLHKDDPKAVPDEQTSALYVRLRAESRQTTGVYAVVPTEEVVIPTVAGYLPHPPTTLVGREDERIEVANRLKRSRLVTLTGLGGIGKTRLAIEVADEVVRQYADGVWLVNLDTLNEDRLVVTQIASVLGLREEPGRPLLQSLIAHLRPKRLLLVLDNCEHLLEACAQAALQLLQQCPEVRILATSREALGITGETVWAVPFLAVPDLNHLPEAQTTLLRVVTSYESVQLFVERAQAALRTFHLNGVNARQVAQVCVQLDGIPLAIELAAARIDAMTVEQIATRLQQGVEPSLGSSATAQSRQQTLQAALDWSYDLLNGQERSLLRRLAGFAGGCSLDAAEYVCAGEEIDERQVLDLLASLVDKSLVVFQEQERVGGRYRLLDMVRQYAAESLRASGGLERIRARHRDWFLALAENAEPQLQGAEQGEWLARLESDHENLRAALAWCREEQDGAEAGLKLAGALWRFWEVRGYYSEGRDYLTAMLSRAESGERTKLRARALNGAGVLASNQGDYPAAMALYEESLMISRELGDRQGAAWPLHHLGLMAAHRGDYTTARALHEESLEIWRELEDKQGIGFAIHQLGSVVREQGDYAAARALYQESLEISRQLGDKQGIAWSLNDLGKAAYDQGDYTAARPLHEESLEISRELGDRQGIGWALHHLGNVDGVLGDYAAARMLYEESLTVFHDLGNKQGIGWTLHHLGNVVGAQGDYGTAAALQQESLAIQRELDNKLGIGWSLNSLGKLAYEQRDLGVALALFAESAGVQRDVRDRRGAAESLEGVAAVMATQAKVEKAVRLWGAAKALRDSIGSPLPFNEREHYSRQVEQARLTLDEAVFTAIWQEGAAMSWQQAVSYALEQGFDLKSP